MSEQGPLIVIVDDDFDSLEIIRNILEPAGYKTLCFTEPMEALQHMAIEKPRLIITDLMMKFIDTGFAFSRQIRFDSRFSNIPIILITAAFSQRRFAVQPQDKRGLEKMGIDAFFDKPVDPDDLLGKVQELLGQSGKEQGK